MRVNEIMSRVVHTIRADATLEHASCLMRDEHIGFLPVVDEVMVEATHVQHDIVEQIGFLPAVEEEVLVGMLTDRDIVVRGIAMGKDPKSTPVSEIMSHRFACCHEDDDIHDAAAVIEKAKVRQVFALNRDEHVVGTLSLDDISAVDTSLSGEALHAIAS